MDIEHLAGIRLGNYEIESLLGRGGMGVVYKARQVNLDRPVALKILPPALSANSSFVKRFQREAHAVAKFSHPNIVQIYDIAQEQDLHFFCMEFVDGQTLDKLLTEKGRFHADEAVEIIFQAAQGIEHAHKNGIIHRDIKLSNIILDEFGHTKIMDFGLARMADERSKLTQAGTLMGTLDYMSPEQCRGEEVDKRTDIYSLGVVLYEILAGNPPFDALNEAALIYKIISEEPTKIARLEPGVPAGLSVVVSRAMAKNRGERFPSISEFLHAIDSYREPTSPTAIMESAISPSIAVLPFENMSADPDQEYFCDGLAEELINALTKLKDLRVIARTSAFAFRGEKADVRDIGEKLNVRTILGGSVRKAGNRLRVTAQLIDVGGGHHLWSERYDRELDDVFAIQDEISIAIVDNLKIKLFGDERERLIAHHDVDKNIYDLYLKGQYFHNKGTVEDLEKAVHLFEQVIEKDPDYAPGYVGLAFCHNYLHGLGAVSGKKIYAIQKMASEKAIELDDRLAYAHVLQGWINMVYDWNWESAEHEFRRAIELTPSFSYAHFCYAQHLMWATRYDEAAREMERALELDPLSVFLHSMSNEIFVRAGRHDRAVEACRKAVELDPNFPSAHLNLSWSYLGKSMYEEAAAAIEKEMRISEGRYPKIEAVIGQIYARIGQRNKTEEILDDLLDRSRTAYISPHAIAILYFMLGENDHGFEWLEKAYYDKDQWLCTLKTQCDDLDSRVVSDPRYVAMLKKIGLAD